MRAAEEIHTYLRRCMADFGLTSHVRLRSEVQEGSAGVMGSGLTSDGPWNGIRPGGRLPGAGTVKRV